MLQNTECARRFAGDLTTDFTLRACFTRFSLAFTPTTELSHGDKFQAADAPLI